MASFKALAVFFIVAVFSAVASAQDVDLPPSPAPTPGIDSGAPTSLTASAVLICASVFLSMAAVLKH